jgi:3-keto-5-aminohexanoate cleavage enzyme
MKDKIVITAALTGGATRKEQHSNVPYTAEEFVREAKRCEEAGAAIVHIHFRDPQTGYQTFDPAIIQEVTQAIRQETKVILNLSTGGIGPGIDLNNRKNVLTHESPEMASLNPGTTNFCFANSKDGTIIYDFNYDNPFKATIEYGGLMKSKAIKPELECFATSHVHNVYYFQQNYDFLVAPLHFSFVFGVLGGTRFDPDSLASFLHAVPAGSTWQGIGVGKACFPVALASAAFGGHIRVGLEDNIYIDSATRTLSKGSWDQVEKAVQIGRMVGREPATPIEARVLLNLPSPATLTG